MSERDIKALEDVARHYDISNDFESYNIRLSSMIICPLCKGRDVLEVGCGTGEMTGELLEVSRSLCVAEPTSRFSGIVRAKYGARIRMFECFVDQIEEDLKFDVIVLSSLLQHVPEPVTLLGEVKRFMRDDTVVVATVPNMTSLHRRVGVKMGVLDDIYGDTDRNIMFQQPGKFDKDRFVQLFSSCGYEIVESFGYMLKPFSSDQMMKLNLGWDVIKALYELGRENEHLASQLFVRARPASGTTRPR